MAQEKSGAAGSGSNGSGDPGLSVKDPEVHQALRDEGASKQRATRIANAAARDGRSAVGHRGGEADDHDDRTVAELRQRAAELGVPGRSSMTKAELVEALQRGRPGVRVVGFRKPARAVSGAASFQHFPRWLCGT